MLTLPPSVRIHLAAQPVDMRKGFDGLMAIVHAWGLDPFTGDLFVFASRDRARLKVLHWDHGGFVLSASPLDAGRALGRPAGPSASGWQGRSGRLRGA